MEHDKNHGWMEHDKHHGWLEHDKNHGWNMIKIMDGWNMIKNDETFLSIKIKILKIQNRVQKSFEILSWKL